MINTGSSKKSSYRALPGVLAWKIPGAGGGGYLDLMCCDRTSFPKGACR